MFALECVLIYCDSFFNCSLLPLALFSTPSLSILSFPSPDLSWCPLQLFKEELTQVKEGMKHINDLAHQLAISDVHLSMENARTLEHLNSRWKVLQVERLCWLRHACFDFVGGVSVRQSKSKADVSQSSECLWFTLTDVKSL